MPIAAIALHDGSGAVECVVSAGIYRDAVLE
jgi:hypothetical protein